MFLTHEVFSHDKTHVFGFDHRGWGDRGAGGGGGGLGCTHNIIIDARIGGEKGTEKCKF